MESEIIPHKAIVTETKQLANIGDFVKLTSVLVRCLQHYHYKLFCCCAGVQGVLLTYGRLISTKEEVCVIIELQPQTATEGGLPLLTDFDCLILLFVVYDYLIMCVGCIFLFSDHAQ